MDFSRRALIVGLVAAPAGMPIGLQTFSVGEMMRADPAAAFATIAEIGYRAVELPSSTAARQRTCGGGSMRPGWRAWARTPFPPG